MKLALFVSVALGAALLFARRAAKASAQLPHAPDDGTTSGQDPRATVVALALSQLGSGEAERYWSEVSPGGHPKTSWCGAFALWVLRRAGLTDVTYDAHGAWFYRLPRTEDPDPADLVFFPDTRHLALVEEVDDRGITTINGAGAGGVVSRGFVTRAQLAERNAEVFSVDPWIRARG